MNCLKLLKTLSFFFILGLCLAACQSNKKDKIDLKLNFQPGDKYQYTTSIEQDITTMGFAHIKLNFTIDLIYEMYPKENGLQKLGVTYDHLALQGSSPQGPVSYDSKNPDQSSTVSEMGKIVGKTFYAYLNPDGTLQKVEGLSALMDTTLGRSLAKGPLTDSSFTMMMRNAFDMYPGKPVAVGESWQKTTSMDLSSFKFNMHNTYTLKSVQDGIANISVTSDLKLPETEINTPNDFKPKMEMSGRQEGSMKVNIATGQIISGTTTQNIEGKMTAAGQEIPMTIKSTIQTKSKKI